MRHTYSASIGVQNRVAGSRRVRNSPRRNHGLLQTPAPATACIRRRHARHAGSCQRRGLRTNLRSTTCHKGGGRTPGSNTSITSSAQPNCAIGGCRRRRRHRRYQCSRHFADSLADLSPAGTTNRQHSHATQIQHLFNLPAALVCETPQKTRQHSTKPVERWAFGGKKHASRPNLLDDEPGVVKKRFRTRFVSAMQAELRKIWL